MRKLTLRTLSFLLIVGMLVSVLPVTVFAAQKNTGTRHELCTSLSSQAIAYYTGDYSPDALVSYETDTTGSCLKAVDSELYNVLQTLMTKTHTYFVKYKGSNGLQDYWPDTDCSKDISKPILFYSDGTGGFNREHVWPKSRASFYQSEGGSDLHHLRPTNEGMNSARSNYTFTNVREYMEKPEEVKLDGKVVLWLNKTYAENTPEEQKTTDNLGMVEVNDNIKGDVARILLYVYTRWEEKNLFENDPNAKPGSSTDENNGLRVFFDRETMLQWCEMDPVDTWEMSRNDATQAVQGNRNVFIDYPELAWLLFGETPPADMDVPAKLPL
ncbi:MAG: endonuclease, partial [Oscillospiraceae bacterium]|nr:endonuclease [Oscillospiraceae bacterium]